MKTFQNYLIERQGLADMGDLHLTDDEIGSIGSDTKNNSITIAKKAISIAMKSGTSARRKVVKFLKDLAQEIPQLENLASQLKDEKVEDFPTDHAKEKSPDVVSRPLSDITASPEE